MHIHSEPLLEHLLRLRRVKRAAVFWTEEREALDMIGGELRCEECIGLTGDNGKERTSNNQYNGRRGQANETARPQMRYGGAPR
jgi:hypothetical protein